MYVVFDTSVLIAAFLNPAGFASRLVRLTIEGDQFLLCLSEAIILEFESKLGERDVEPKSLVAFTDVLRSVAVMASVKAFTPEQIASDEHVLACAQDCAANLVVSSDKRLVRGLKQLQIAAVRPSEFQGYFESVSK